MKALARKPGVALVISDQGRGLMAISAVISNTSKKGDLVTCTYINMEQGDLSVYLSLSQE